MIAAAVLPVLIGERHRWVPMRDRMRRLMIGALAAAYPVVAAVLGASSLSVYTGDKTAGGRITGAIDAWSEPLGSRGRFVLALAVVLVGWLFVRDASLRLGLGVGALALTVLLSPVALGVFERLGVAPTAWRFVWMLPVALIAGLVIDAAGRRRVLSLALIAAFAVLLPFGSGGSGTKVTRNVLTRPAWDLDIAQRDAAERLVRLVDDGDLVAAPQRISLLVPTVSSTVYVASPRRNYTLRLGDTVGRRFRAKDRLTITEALGGKDTAAGEIERIIEDLSIDAVCATSRKDELVEGLEGAGMEQIDRRGQCRYWTSG